VEESDPGLPAISTTRRDPFSQCLLGGKKMAEAAYQRSFVASRVVSHPLIFEKSRQHSCTCEDNITVKTQNAPF